MLPYLKLALGLLCLAPNLALAQGVPVGSPGPSPAAELAQPAPGGGYLLNNYSIDDGTTDQCWGLTLGGTMCWLQAFDTRPNADFDVIYEVQVSYGFPQNPGFCVPDGTPVTACLWEDPTEDGDPSDAVLVSLANGTVQNRDTQVLNSIPVPPVTVRGIFYAGVFLRHFTNQFPASRDTGTPSLGRAFFVGTLSGVTTFDPTNLTGLGHTQIFSMNVPGGGAATSVWRVRATGAGTSMTSYCQAKLNSLGCVPQIIGSGAPQASAFAGFVVRGSNLRNNKSGLLFYGISGRLSFPFQGGTLCVKSPIKRTPSRNSGGTPAPVNDCTGVYEIDMMAFAHGFYGGTPIPNLLQIGTLVDCQWWGRDPGFPAPNNATLTGGFEYTVLP